MNESSLPNLMLRPPRSPRIRLGGFVILPRLLDKGRATLAGHAGEYIFNSPTDQHWLRFAGIVAEELKAELALGKGDGEILAWVHEHAQHPRQPWEIQLWNAYFNERGPDSDAETLEFFSAAVGKFSPVREDIKTWFDLIDLDDYVSFGGRS